MEKIIRFIIKLVDLILNILNHKKLVKFTNEYKQQFQYFHSEEFCDDEDGFYYIKLKPIFYKYQIHKFECKYYNNKLYLCIELDNPGVLIGKGGSNIDEIKKHLNIDIHIEESKLWKVKY